MEFFGKLKSIYFDVADGEWNITFSTTEYIEMLGLELKEKLLNIKAVIKREKRSLNANALFWHCAGEVSKALRISKWEVYLNCLRDYGEYTYLIVKPHAVSQTMKMWRECEVLGEIEFVGENGKKQKGVQLLCYFGSSTYDTKQFSILLDGIGNMMEDVGLKRPEPREVKNALDRWQDLLDKGEGIDG